MIQYHKKSKSLDSLKIKKRSNKNDDIWHVGWLLLKVIWWLR